MLYRYTLTLDVDNDTPKSSIEILREVIKNSASLLSPNINVKLEDEEAIQNNKKVLYKPIINTIDEKFDPNNEIGSSIKYLLAYIKQLEADNQQENDFHKVLITAMNSMIICNGDKINQEQKME